MSGQPLIDISQLSPDVFGQLIPVYGAGNNGQVLTIVGNTPEWQTVSATSLGGIAVLISSPINGDVLTYESGYWINAPATTGGTVTNVSVTGSTGLSVGVTSPSTTPIITLTLSTELQGLSGLSSVGYVYRTGPGAYTTQAISLSDVTTALGYTPYDAANPASYLTASAIFNLTGDVTGSGSQSSGIVTTLAPSGVSAGTYNNVTVNARGQVTAGGNTPYLTGNQSVTVTGDVTGSGTTAITLTLGTTGVTPGTYAGAWNATTVTIPNFTVNAKGLITAAGTTNYTRTLFTSLAQGEVSASGGGTTNFLRADGTWSTPSTNPGTVTSVAAIGSTGLTVGGSPITGSGTLTFTLNAELQGLAGLGSVGVVQRTSPGTYTVAALTNSQITTALGYTPVATIFTINTTAPLLGGANLSSGPMTLSIQSFNASGGTLSGYVAANATVTGTEFLRDDGTWVVPAGGGGSLTATQVGFGNGSNVLTGSSNLTYSAAGNLVIAAPSSGITLTASGNTSYAGAFVSGTGASGTQLGLLVRGGATSADYALIVENTATTAFLTVNGLGNVIIGPPTSGTGLTVNAADGTNACVFQDTGSSVGIAVEWSDSVGTRGWVGTGSSSFIGANIADIGLNCISGTLRLGYGAAGNTAVAIAPTGNVTINAPTSGISMTINNALGNDCLDLNANGPLAASIGFLTGSSTYRGYIGASGSSSGQLIAGSGTGDMNIRTEGGNINFSTTAGASIQMQIAAGSGNVIVNGTLTVETSTISTAGISYGSVIVTGATSGYAGIQFPGTGVNVQALMIGQSATPVTGIYSLTNASWDWYFTGSTLTQGIVPAANIGSGTAAINISGTAAAASAVANYSGRTDATAYPVLWSPPGGPGGGEATYSCAAVTITSSTGTVTATVFDSTSDRRLKKNITKIDNALSIIESLNGVRFDWIDSDIPSAGLIAQDVQPVMPELVTNNEKRNQLSLNYNGIIAVLVEAIKELKAEIETLKAQ